MSQDKITSDLSLWWIVPGKLAGMRRPKPDEWEKIQSLGVGAIVSLQDDDEVVKEMYEPQNIPHLHLPTPGGGAPSKASVLKLQEYVHQVNANGKAVAVHCQSGNRRTGTACAGYLIMEGMGVDEALQIIAKQNPKAELRDPQIQFLRELQTVE